MYVVCTISQWQIDQVHNFTSQFLNVVANSYQICSKWMSKDWFIDVGRTLSSQIEGWKIKLQLVQQQSKVLKYFDLLCFGKLVSYLILSLSHHSISMVLLLVFVMVVSWRYRNHDVQLFSLVFKYILFGLYNRLLLTGQANPAAI